MKRSKGPYRLVTDDHLLTISEIVGPASAATLALEDIRKRLARGESPVCFIDPKTKMYVVCDRATADEDGLILLSPSEVDG